VIATSGLTSVTTYDGAVMSSYSPHPAGTLLAAEFSTILKPESGASTKQSQSLVDTYPGGQASSFVFFKVY